jgi:hypothetical protein
MVHWLGGGKFTSGSMKVIVLEEHEGDFAPRFFSIQQARMMSCECCCCCLGAICNLDPTLLLIRDYRAWPLRRHRPMFFPQSRAKNRSFGFESSSDRARFFRRVAAAFVTIAAAA